MVNGPFTVGNGRIAADLFDFRKHVSGTDFLHTADSITTSPGVGGATNVQTSINNINTFIASLADLGTSFVAIPDGYDCYTDPAPNFYFSNTVPPLNDFLIPLFAAIMAGGTMPAGYERLKDGGILYIPAGTYYIDETVEVPPSIILFGEGYNTKIINATSINIALSPPQIDAGATQVPVFIIKADLNRSVNDTAIDAENTFMFSKATKFINLTIGDNFIEPTLLGDIYYRLPQNTIGDCPLIMQEQGSYFEMQDVKMLGRALTTTEEVSTDGATRFAVKLDTVSGSSSGTILKIINCFIDGFNQPISFASRGGTNDYLDINNCKIRSHGYLDNDGSSAESNCVIFMNDNNANITSNYFYGNHALCKTVVFIDSQTDSVQLQSKSKIIVASNHLAIHKPDNSEITPTIIGVNSGLVTLIYNTANLIAYGNVFDSSFKVEGPNGTYLSSTKDLTTLHVGVKHRAATVTTSTYTIDGTSPDYLIFADTTNTVITITLPAHDTGRTIIIKDIGFNASTNNITLTRSGGTGTIEDYSGDRIIATNGASWTLVSNGSNWYIV